ncbi:MAG: hypothetical protein LBF93_12090 [Zoogloeaceae bacterium]|jgi:hypothetical protein|nr:hypothetical protein [Zoogloeaceae bacterium]
MKRFIPVALLSFLACVMTPLAHATRTVPMPVFKNEVIASATGDDAAKRTHDAIVGAAAQNKWLVVSDNGDTLRLSITVRRKHKVLIDAHIRGNAVDIDYVSSVNMAYDKDALSGRAIEQCDYLPATCPRQSGEAEVIHPNYGVWINRLLSAARKAAN